MVKYWKWLQRSSYLFGAILMFILQMDMPMMLHTFGQTDSTRLVNGKLKLSPSVTVMVIMVIFFLKDANGVTDQSGQSNNFTVGGTLLTTKTILVMFFVL